MTEAQQIKNWPRGNTQKNVNRDIYEIVQRFIVARPQKEMHVLDVPCGEAEFSIFLKSQFPGLSVIGVDPFSNPVGSEIVFHKQSCGDFFKKFDQQNYFDLVMCVSGFMCFDGAEEHVNSFFKSGKSSSILILTNDNVMTIRDRLNFLIFGRMKRFALFYKKNEGNWNLIFPQGIHMLLRRAGYKNISFKYTALYFEDLFFLPLAFIIWPIFFLSILATKSELSFKEKLEIFPFLSLFSRHYIVVAEKN